MSSRLPKTIAPYKLVMIEWVDASTIADQWEERDLAEKATLCRCVSVGYIVRAEKDFKVLVPTVSWIDQPEKAHHYGSILIPRKMILREKVLKWR